MPQKQPEAPSKPSLNRIIAEINKKYDDHVIGRIPDMVDVVMPRISTGIKVLDDAIGGGFPKRRIIELYGKPSSGKSLISMKCIAEAQKQGLDCVYVDVEDSFDPVFAEKLGVDTKKLIIVQSSIGEDTLEFVCKLLAGEPGVIVVDSVAAMITQAELDEDISKAFMAPKARLMSKGMARITALNKSSVVIFINQLRATMAMYGAPTATTGGNALPHAASIRIEVKKGELLRVDGKKTTDVIGQLVAFNVAKNKTAAPFKQGSFKFFYEDAHIE